MDEPMSIAQVSKASGVTSRTLRHYDGIGLLPPAFADASGRRFYRRDQLIRLQQILLLRELGLGLDTIAEILDGTADRAEALRLHRKWLLAERDRLDRLAGTVARTINELEGGERMSAKELFDGFSPDSETAKQLAREAADRWGSQATQSHERSRNWSTEKWAAVNRQGGEATDRLIELARAGVPADDERVLDAVAAHRAWLEHHWTPDAESYTGLGRLYADDERFRSRYDKLNPGFAEYLRDAIAAYARARMG
ncbi:MerR family transcriptional regulator [Amycolatopsis thermophila]|uniref:DNA-binding transcriptional MerR regulator n=1 Tax=Amycolatopsis thermophila TaxID=206084 RepID=A0ABU0ETT5_9PSEU|nr:MerR family transcriptional regulator [Amycolatopsis thermophila]MDQ0378724.1 DNA-binding transcriptional MerR regulator [Amycolatopsis thermophila]